MKTSIAKKLRDRLLAAFMAIAVMLSYVVPSAITASAATGGYVNGNGLVDVTGTELQLQAEDGSLVNVNESGETGFGKKGVHFKFAWTLAQNYVDQLVREEVELPVTLEVDLSEYLHDINITTKGESSVTNSEGLNASYRFDGQKLYITITSVNVDKNKPVNTQNFGGGGYVDGELDITEDSIPEGGKVTVEFFDKTYKAVYTPKSAYMNVGKSVSGIRYDPATKEFYADFTVNIVSWSKDLENIKFTDTCEYGSDEFFVDGVMRDVTVHMDGSEIELGEKKAGEQFDLTGVELARGKQATVTYSVKINPEKSSAKNTVNVDANDGTLTGSADAWANASMPSATKTGSLEEDSGKIKWTIGVYLDVLKSEGVPEGYKKFTVSDKSGDEKVKKSLASIEGVTPNEDGSYNIPLTLFEDKGDGYYEYTYYTELDDEDLSPMTGKTITNDVTVQFNLDEKTYDATAQGSVYIKGVGVGEIDKEFVGLLPNGRISWKVDVTLPDMDMVSLKLVDTTKYWGDKYLDHKVVIDTLEINGKPYSEACKKREEWHLDDEDDYCKVLYDGVEFELSSEFLAENRGKTVTITYQTQAVDASGNVIKEIDPMLNIYNKAEFTLKLDGEDITKYDEYTKTPKFDARKESVGFWQKPNILNVDDLDHPLMWSIDIDGLYNAEDILKPGDTFTVTDILPKFYTLKDCAWGVSANNFTSADAYYADLGKDITVKQEEGSREAVFTVTVSEEMIEKLKEKETDGKWHLFLVYSTYVPEKFKQEAQMEYYRPNESGYSSVQVTNTADVSFNGETVKENLKASQDIVYENPKLLNKELSKDKNSKNNFGTIVSTEETVDGELKHYLVYEVKINENAKIIGDVDENGKPVMQTLEAVDNLGYGMTFGKVLSGIDADNVRVSKNKQKITFTLENQKAYTIVYKVYIDHPADIETVTDALERFGNTISLEGGNGATARVVSKMNTSTYTAQFYIYADTNYRYITVSGTKIWENMDGYAPPKEIIIQVKQTNIETGEEKILPYVVGTSDDCDINCIVDGDTWTFSIPKLVTYDGTYYYKYDIEEISIDGYSVEYTGVHTDLTNAVKPEDYNFDTDIVVVKPLNITNTRDEDYKPETVDITINKEWVGGTERPDVKVTLSDGNGYSKEYTLGEKNEWTVTVTGLPKFDKDGNKITYTVTEEEVDGYTSNVTNADYTFTVTNTYKPTPQKPEEPKPETVDITINKEWVGGTEKPDVTVTLSDGNGYSKDLTLNADNSWTVTVKDLPKFDGKGNEITYTVIEKKVENYDSVVTNDGYTFTVTNTYKPTPQQPEEPKPTKVEISKKDITNGKELPGAKLKVVDKDGNVIKEWVSTDKPTYFENVFKAGETYTLIEETAPDGYTVAEEVKFTVKADGTLTTVEMFDSKKPQQPEEPKPTKVEISKKDITNGKELPGAKLKVVDKNGNVIKEWVSTDKPTYFENVFKAGKTYTLIEETAPDGYTVAEEVKFTVKADGTLTTVEMFDSKKPQQPEEPKPTKVEISKKDITNGKELPGAKLKVVDENGKVIKEWTSTDKPTYFENVFEAGKKYTLIEETAPDGYTVAEEVKFTVKADGTLTTVEMFDSKKPQQPEEPKPTKVEISKKDITNGKELPGAKLKVVDKDGNVIKEWVSTDKPTYFENVFEAGETYTLIEETAPDGYTVAEEVKFTVKADGTLTTVEMFDSKKPQQPEEPKPTKVEISKKDITNGKELPGAKLKVVDKDGNVIKEWVSTDKPTYFENVFEAGKTYTLIEETAPDGYTVAEKVEFTVNADGTLTTVQMFDSKKPQQPEEPKPTKVQISKKDITNGKELPGAKLKVVDKNGKVIKEWVSTDKPTYFENVFEAGETYTLIEETAPDGYTVAEKVEFTVKENGELTVVEMFDAVKTGTDTDNDSNDKDSGVAQGGGSNDKVTDNDDSPKTGSSCNITLVMLALALGVMAVTNKKRRNH